MKFMFIKKAGDWPRKADILTFHLTALECVNTLDIVTASSVNPHYVVALAAVAPAFIVERT